MAKEFRSLRAFRRCRKPYQFLNRFVGEKRIGFNANNALRLCSEKNNHNLYCEELQQKTIYRLKRKGNEKGCKSVMVEIVFAG